MADPHSKARELWKQMCEPLGKRPKFRRLSLMKCLPWLAGTETVPSFSPFYAYRFQLPSGEWTEPLYPTDWPEEAQGKSND